MKEAASNITTSKWILFVDRCRGEDPEHKVLGREVSVWTHEDNIKKNDALWVPLQTPWTVKPQKTPIYLHHKRRLVAHTGIC